MLQIQKALMDAGIIKLYKEDTKNPKQSIFETIGFEFEKRCGVMFQPNGNDAPTVIHTFNNMQFHCENAHGHKFKWHIY